MVELIRQLVARGLRVLACAPSNLAVDNLVEKLGEKLPVRQGKQTYEMSQAAAGMADGSIAASSSAAFTAALANSAAAASSLQSNRGYDIRLCRLGHPARIIPSVLQYTLDSVVKTSDAESVCSAMRADMAALNKAVDKSRDRQERNGMRREVRELQRALRDRERRAIAESLRSTEVLCCTLVNAASKLMDQFGPNGAGSGFDVVVIDEAAQALEVACLLPIIKGRKLILAGDNQQLGPTVKSKEACAGGLERTLFDRLYAKEYGQRITTMLVEQYRMNGVIMKWSSDELYQGRLIVRRTERTSNSDQARGTSAQNGQCGSLLILFVCVCVLSVPRCAPRRVPLRSRATCCANLTAWPPRRTRPRPSWSSTRRDWACSRTSRP